MCVSISSAIAENNQKTEVPLTTKTDGFHGETCKPHKVPYRNNFPLSIYFNSEESTLEFISVESNLVTFSIFDENENVVMSSVCQLYPDSPYIVTLDSILDGIFRLEITINSTVFIGQIVI